MSWLSALDSSLTVVRILFWVPFVAFSKPITWVFYNTVHWVQFTLDRRTSPKNGHKNFKITHATPQEKLSDLYISEMNLKNNHQPYKEYFLTFLLQNYELAALQTPGSCNGDLQQPKTCRPFPTIHCKTGFSWTNCRGRTVMSIACNELSLG